MKVGSLVGLVRSDDTLIRLKNHGNEIPIKDVIYTVRYSDGIGIRLEEIVNPILQYTDGKKECIFASSLFAELQPPIDISELIEELIYATI